MGEPWMLASCHIMAQTTDWVVYLVCRSFSPTQRNYTWPLGPPKLTQDVSNGRCKRSLRLWPHTGAFGVGGWGKTASERVWSLGVDNATSLSAGVPPLHLGWRLVKKTAAWWPARLGCNKLKLVIFVSTARLYHLFRCEWNNKPIPIVLYLFSAGLNVALKSWWYMLNWETWNDYDKAPFYMVKINGHFAQIVDYLIEYLTSVYDHRP